MATIERETFTQPWSRRSFLLLLKNKNVLFFVAADEADRVLGYSITYIAADESELANLAVTEECRGTGVGRQLLLSAMSAARARGARSMFLEVRESNVAAQSLYQSAGFQQVSRRRRYYEEPVEDALVMRCNFPESDAAAATD